MRLLGFSMFLALWAVPRLASAQEPDLYHHRAGAELMFAVESSELLASALDAKVFDLALTKSFLEEVKRTLTDAKRSVDRVAVLLPDSKSALEGDCENLRKAIKRAEDQATRLADELKTQTANLEPEDSDDGAPTARERGADAKPVGAQPDWQALRDQAAWLYFDALEAKTIHAKLTKKLRPAPPKKPKKPKAKRQ